MEVMDILGLFIVSEGGVGIIPAQSFVTRVRTEDLTVLPVMDVTCVVTYIQSSNRNNRDKFIVSPVFERGFQGLDYWVNDMRQHGIVLENVGHVANFDQASLNRTNEQVHQDGALRTALSTLTPL